MSYKIRLTESDSLTDITQMLYQLGFKWRGFPLKDGVKFLCARDGVIGFISSENSFKEGFKDLKEITVKELRSMVKPKEYLFKGTDGTYKVVDHDCQGRAIEIPEGAVKLIKNESGSSHFVSSNGQFMADYDIKNSDGYWYDPAVTMEYYMSSMGGSVLWQRNPIDIDKITYDCDSKLGNFVVDETLQERQSQYGEFKEVADTTQKLMSFLTGNGYTCVQLESLHMICSKLARIAHGDPNHTDSWHDIAGYATLVVKDIS